MKSTTLTVAAAAMVIFVQSAQARERHHGHRHHHSLMASRGTFVGERATSNGLFAFAAADVPSIAAVYRGAIKRVRLPGAAGRCVASSAWIRVRHSIWRATGRIGAGRDRPELALAAPCRQDRRSAKRRMDRRIRQRRPCASHPPSLDCRRDCDQVELSSPFLESKGPPKYRAAQFLKNTVRAIGLLPSAACCSGQC